MEAETVPQLFPRPRTFLSLYLIQEQWHPPNHPMSINHLRPVRHEGIQLFPQPRCQPAGRQDHKAP
ncbi:hypothetical protein GCM10010261_19450 [Streptomyces pilosus]|nr:hypothetical protein GCM10010261_19450 [Streptomyces pilosus]